MTRAYVAIDADVRREDWRDVPLLTALSYGVSSVEADVSLINGTLFVSGRALSLNGIKHERR